MALDVLNRPEYISKSIQEWTYAHLLIMAAVKEGEVRGCYLLVE